MNWYLISPQLSLGALALLVILLDLFIREKRFLAVVGAIGLAVPFGFAVSLWGHEEATLYGRLAVDGFSLFFCFLFLGIAFLTLLYSTDYLPRMPGREGEYYALILLSTTGFTLLAAARELISIYLALELSSLPLYALAAFLRDEKSTEAGIKYLLLGAIASAVLLYGMALIFGLTGRTGLSEIAQALAAGGIREPALLFGVVLLIAGFGFKIASVPFHWWVPDVYEGAPTPVTAYISVGSKAAGFAVILRVFYEAFGQPAWLLSDWSLIIAVLSALTMTLGNVVAIWQKNIKRMLGYSGIANAGYIMVGLAAASSLGRSGVLFFLAAYTLANIGAFTAVIAISNKLGSDLIEDYSGMARRAPALALALAIFLISLTGIPPTAGFMAKVYVFNAGLQAGLLWLVIIGVINSVISAYYYLRVVKVMFLGQPASEEGVPSSIPLRAVLLITALGVFLLGVFPYGLLYLAERATLLLP